MNRLTKKHKPHKHIRYTDKTMCLKNYNMKYTKLNEAIEKLGKLEDIEQELGCPIEIVFEALKGKKIIYKYDNNNRRYYGTLIWSSYGQEFALSIATTKTMPDICVKTSDYQKTWWLKGEKDANL